MIEKIKIGFEEIIIREAKINDAENLTDFIYQIAGETDFLKFGEEDEIIICLEKQKEFLKKKQEKINDIYIIAEIGNRIIGGLEFTAGTTPRTMHTGELGISVLKKYWGKGIGKILIKTLTKWATSKKIIKKINLKVRTDNHRAIRLYKKLGFKQEGVISREFFVNNKLYDSYAMGLEIN